MFERYFFESIKNHNYIKIFLFSLIITLLLSFVNSFIGSNALFLVALISLALAPTLITYFKQLNSNEIKRIFTPNKLISNHLEEIVISWSLFLGVSIGFYLSIIGGFTTELVYHEAFTNQLSAMMTQFDELFLPILFNNLTVALFTFVLSFLIFSAMIFMIVWNASLVSYYITTLTSSTQALSHSLLILPHGLLEIAGFVLAGIAGGILSQRFEDLKTLNREQTKEFREDIAFLLLFSFLFILIAAGIESF
ncbi:MAG: stage II sporulation protein M [Candidatus Nanoarchaeia archaeon]